MEPGALESRYLLTLPPGFIHPKPASLRQDWLSGPFEGAGALLLSLRSGRQRPAPALKSRAGERVGL